LNDPVTTANRTKWTKIMARKRVPTFSILARDDLKLIDAVKSEPQAAAY
jgi:hypothetical protein